MGGISPLSSISATLSHVLVERRTSSSFANCSRSSVPFCTSAAWHFMQLLVQDRADLTPELFPKLFKSHRLVAKADLWNQQQEGQS